MNEITAKQCPACGRNLDSEKSLIFCAHGDCLAVCNDGAVTYEALVVNYEVSLDDEGEPNDPAMIRADVQYDRLKDAQMGLWAVSIAFRLVVFPDGVWQA